MPSGGCKGDTVPLAVEQWYDFPEFGGYLGNVGSVSNRPEIGVRNIMSIVVKRNQSSLLETQHLHSLDLTPCISSLMQNRRTQTVPGLSAFCLIETPHSSSIREKRVRKALAWTV